MEEWRKIEGYSEYEVSNLGKVRSKINGRIKILKQNLDRHGYWQISIGLRKNKKYRKNCFVHRLVAFAFCFNNNLSNNSQVHHIDKNKKNNISDNLRWVSPRYNSNQKKDILSFEKVIGKVYEIIGFLEDYNQKKKMEESKENEKQNK